jgi:dipeptidyl aminopeptidase/acylaminoacyl peptidase
MRYPTRFVVGALAAALALPAGAQHTPTIKQWLAPGYPSELASARKTDKLAWQAYEEGKRNVYFAQAPDFTPRRITSFLKDDGTDLTNIEISDDGSTVVFIRGSSPNRDGWVANPSADPDGAERAIWAVKTAVGSGPAWRVAEGSNPELSPDGRWVLYVKDGQIFRAAVNRAEQTDSMSRGLKPFIKEWGSQSNPRWAPDGQHIAFVSTRTDHSFVTVYDVKTRTVKYIAPYVDFDVSPTWSADSRHLAFVRTPGLPFGRGPLAQPANAQAGAAAGRGGRGGGRGGGGRGGRGGRSNDPRIGMFDAAFEDGSTIKVMIGDIMTGDAREIWHNAPGDEVFTNINAITWAGDALLFQMEPEEWILMYSLSTTAANAKPVVLTPREGMIGNESNQSQWAVSQDGKWMYYSTNVGDIDRRHIWKVPTSGGDAVQVTTAEIETYPMPLASGKYLAVMSATALRPQSVGIWPTTANAAKSTEKVVYPKLGKDFPMAESVVPTNVTLKADDGLEFHNQIFLPKDLKPGEKRPAIVFVHGGSRRQMLLGYHYLSFYHVFYAVNQWLASQGYIVISVNYRSGIGYGKAFRMAPNVGAQGNAEYKDVLAAGKYLQTRDDVDPKRVGIWGLSYGGLLTAQALARNSDIFITGVDLAGVHLQGNTLDTNSVSYKASSISEMDKWKSPVLLLQGDDDRNVPFSQTVGLVQLLRAHKVYYELTVIPDDVHETLLHSRWLNFFGQMEPWLDRFLKRAEKPPMMGGGGAP